jgi:hypothetical protein
MKSTITSLSEFTNAPWRKRQKALGARRTRGVCRIGPGTNLGPKRPDTARSNETLRFDT